MKVLHVTTHFNMGGISNYIFTLSGALKPKGVDVIVASSGGDMVPALERSGIRHIDLNIGTKFEFGPKAILSGIRLARIANEDKVDIIHAHSRVSQVAAMIASRLSGVKVVTTCHGYFKKRLRGVIDAWGARVVAISEAVREHLARDLSVKNDRIALIYSGVDVSRFGFQESADRTARAKSELGLKEGPVIGTIGRLSSIKGQKYFILAMRSILEHRPDAQAVLLGSGPEETALKRLVRSEDIAGSVYFFASCADTAKFLSAMDVFVFPSIKEGLGIALLEALAAGKACVASSVGGIGDIIKDGQNGLLVEAGDHSAISEAVLKLIGNEALRKEMGRNGRALVGERFTIDAMAENMARLYKEVAGRGI